MLLRDVEEVTLELVSDQQSRAREATLLEQFDDAAIRRNRSIRVRLLERISQCGHEWMVTAYGIVQHGLSQPGCLEPIGGSAALVREITNLLNS